MDGAFEYIEYIKESGPKSQEVRDVLSLDYKDKRPIYEQIAEKLKELMLLGAFPENTRLPGVRSLAVELAINPNTVQRAYAQLEREGYIYSVKGKGNFAAQSGKLKELKLAEITDRLLDTVDHAKKFGMSDEEIIKLIRQRAGGDICDKSKRIDEEN